MIHAVPWDAPKGVKAYFTCRREGSSEGVYSSFNLGDHVDDSPENVAANRQQLISSLSGLQHIQWLEQVHGTAVYSIDGDVSAKPPRADASICALPNIACTVMTADCLPVLLTDVDGNQVAAVHAGWRGLCTGVLSQAIVAFDAPPNKLLAWIGPGISQRHFEVGAEVRKQFLDQFDLKRPGIEQCFLDSKKTGRYMADLPRLASQQMESLGLKNVARSAICTYADAARFYSYRRDGQTGRFACLIYKTDAQ